MAEGSGLSLVTLSMVMALAVAGFLLRLAGAVLIAWLAFSLGRWLGAREARREDAEHEGPVGSVVAATLALLAFTLAARRRPASARAACRVRAHSFFRQLRRAGLAAR